MKVNMIRHTLFLNVLVQKRPAETTIVKHHLHPKLCSLCKYEENTEIERGKVQKIKSMYSIFSVVKTLCLTQYAARLAHHCYFCYLFVIFKNM